MSLITPPTADEALKALKLSMVERIAEAVNHTIIVTTTVNLEFWALPIDQLLAALNANLAETAGMLQGSLELALQLNASQDAAGLMNPDGSPRFPARAPTERGRADIVFDAAAMQWVHLPPPVVEEPTEQ